VTEYGLDSSGLGWLPAESCDEPRY